MRPKSNFYIVSSNTWQPSTFYDSETKLVWVMSYALFKNIYLGKIANKDGVKYAIHKDVYNAFYFKYKNSQLNKTRKYKDLI